jgi:hypothetical protein
VRIGYAFDNSGFLFPARELNGYPLSETSVYLHWSEPIASDNTFIGYNIFRDGELVNPAPHIGLSFTDTDLTNGENYTYRIIAVYTEGESVSSNLITVSPRPVVFSPPQNLEASNETPEIIVLSWEMPAEGSDGVFSHFRVYRDDVPVANDITALRFEDSDVLPETSYSYFVTARYTAPEGESSASNTVVIQPTNEVDDPAVPIKTELLGNYPNPFNPATSIRFNLAKSGKLNLQIFNIKGQLVNTLANEYFEGGRHTLNWHGVDQNGSNVGSGIYFYRMETDNYSEIRRMILLK